MDKVREALESNEVRGAIGRFRGVRDFFDIGDMSAESDGNILADAIEEAIASLTQPQPEAREEDIANVLGFMELARHGVISCDAASSASDSFGRIISRLAAKEGQKHTSCDGCRWSGYSLCAMPFCQECKCNPDAGDYSSWTPPATSEKPEWK